MTARHEGGAGDGHVHDAGTQDHPGDHGHGHSHGTAGVRGWLKEFLRPHGHDPADSVDAALEGSSEGIRAVKISLVALGVTAALQLVLVWISGSVALLADTVHNFADASTSIPLWIAFSLGRRAASRRYTYGYGRAEDLAGLLVILMIAASAIFAAWESFDRLLDPRTVEYPGWVLVAGVLGFAGNELVAHFRISVGRRIGSESLIADGVHARTDGLTSLAVAAGAVGVLAGFPRSDAIVGLLISALIVVMLKDAAGAVLRRAMDGVDPHLVEQVEHTVRAVPGVRALGRTRVRWIGHRVSVDAEVVLDDDLPLRASHAIADEVEHQLRHAVPALSEASVRFVRPTAP